MQKIPSIFVYNLTFLALETLPLQSKHKQLGKKRARKGTGKSSSNKLGFWETAHLPLP